MLDDETFRKILEAHGATITGVPGVYIDGEKKTLEELHSDTVPCANGFGSAEEYAQAVTAFSDGRTPKEPKLKLSLGGDGGCIESAEGMGAVADKLAEGLAEILEGFKEQDNKDGKGVV